MTQPPDRTKAELAAAARAAAKAKAEAEALRANLLRRKAQARAAVDKQGKGDPHARDA